MVDLAGHWDREVADLTAVGWEYMVADFVVHWDGMVADLTAVAVGWGCRAVVHLLCWVAY